MKKENLSFFDLISNQKIKILYEQKGENKFENYEGLVQCYFFTCHDREDSKV